MAKLHPDVYAALLEGFRGYRGNLSPANPYLCSSDMWEAYDFGQALAWEGLHPELVAVEKRRGSTWEADSFRGRFVYSRGQSPRFERLFPGEG